jgi:hypothetical protein
MGGSILEGESVGARTVRALARRRAWRPGASACFGLILAAALVSVLARAPAKVAATVLAARTQGGW